ncbi:hypothetical protein V6N13_069513 [Hibiscus sabdariffa]|uniref:Uncharacterized protein n=1 Tax=Hibiscus sabdariffa TaxID=183260 RepID=A0ABR2PGG7_9ROSI
MESSSPDLMPETPRPTSNPTPNPIKNSDPDTHCSSEQEDDPAEGSNKGAEKKVFVDPAALRRNSSVSSAYALQLQAAVKTAFSMRRSCSVSESYSRIHDQCATLTPPLSEDQVSESVKKKKKNTGDKILKAWKKIFRL